MAFFGMAGWPDVAMASILWPFSRQQLRRKRSSCRLDASLLENGSNQMLVHRDMEAIVNNFHSGRNQPPPSQSCI